MSEYQLLPHPSTPCPAIERFSVRVDRVSADLLVLYYQLIGDIDSVLLPSQQRSAHADELWKCTCFEAFIAPAGASHYIELNFSPSSEWAAYAFERYRVGMRTIAPAEPPRILCRRREGELGADVDVHLGSLGVDTAAVLSLGLAAVLQDQQGALSYWALSHPAPKPDFHLAAAFTASVPAPESAS